MGVHHVLARQTTKANKLVLEVGTKRQLVTTVRKRKHYFIHVILHPHLGGIYQWQEIEGNAELMTSKIEQREC